jgi:hypothetical protein
MPGSADLPVDPFDDGFVFDEAWASEAPKREETAQERAARAARIAAANNALEAARKTPPAQVQQRTATGWYARLVATCERRWEERMRSGNL